jgi:hypothetical protein
MRASKWLAFAGMLVNLWNVLFWCFLAEILLINLIGVAEGGVLQFVLWSSGKCFFILSLICVPLWFAFKLGLIKCPCCGESFAMDLWSFRYALSPQCVNCGYDPATISRQGDF